MYNTITAKRAFDIHDMDKLLFHYNDTWWLARYRSEKKPLELRGFDEP